MKNKGFTLIELVIVIAIVAIIFAIVAIPHFNDVSVSTPIKNKKIDLHILEKYDYGGFSYGEVIKVCISNQSFIIGGKKEILVQFMIENDGIMLPESCVNEPYIDSDDNDRTNY